MGSGRLGRRRSRTHRHVERTAQRNAGRSPPAFSFAYCSVLDRPRHRRRPAGPALFPQSAVPENLLDHLSLVPFDEGDDPQLDEALDPLLIAPLQADALVHTET